jgi:hypothetical protein
MYDVFHVASGRRHVLLVAVLAFEIRFGNADAVRVSSVLAVRSIVQVGRVLLLLALQGKLTTATHFPVTEPEVTSEALFGHPETTDYIVTNF